MKDGMLRTHFVLLTFILLILVKLASVDPLPLSATTSSPIPVYQAFFKVAQNLPLVLYNNLVCNTISQSTTTLSATLRRLRYIDYDNPKCTSTAVPSSIVDIFDYGNLMKKLSRGFQSVQERQAWTQALNSSTLTVLNTIVNWAFGATSDAEIRKVPDIIRTFLLSSTSSKQEQKNQLADLLLSLEKKIVTQGDCSPTERVRALFLNQYFAKDFLRAAVNFSLSQQGIVGNVTTILDAISTLYPQRHFVVKNFQNLFSGATVSDLPAACYLLDLYTRAPSTHCGTALLAQTAYTSLKCSTNSSQPLPSASATTITISTTTRPTAQNCGISTVASRLANVSNSEFFTLPRIVGGTPVGSCKAIPWQVRITVDDLELCGASIIDQKHLLTAAHCVPSGAKLEIVAGEYDLLHKESSEQYLEVSKIAVHPNYTTLTNGAMINDVAVLTLGKPLNFSNPCIAPVCLIPNYTVAAGGEKCTVSGWGTTKYDGMVSIVLQSVSIKTHQGSECASTFGFGPLMNYVPTPSMQLCAGDPVNGGKDACQGDSGGPLTCQTSSGHYVQVGVVSYGKGCATAQYPGVYASVSAYYDWIQQQL